MKINLKIKIFADGIADLDDVIELNKHPLVEGFTFSPSVMKKSGIKNYKGFAKEIIKYVPYKPICFDVLTDEFREMEKQAKDISSWGNNIWVKIPVTNSNGESSCDLITRLCNDGIKVNVVSVFTFSQVDKVMKAIGNNVGIISIYAGEISDASVNPEGIIKYAIKATYQKYPNQEILWASTRESYNVIQADRLGCQIITCSKDIIHKTLLFGKNLQDYSREIVKLFMDESIKTGYTL